MYRDIPRDKRILSVREKQREIEIQNLIMHFNSAIKVLLLFTEIRVDAHYFGELRLSLVQADGYHDSKTESHFRMYRMSR